MTTQPNYLHTGNYHDGKKSLADMDKLIGKGYSPIVADDIISEPYAKGTKFTSRPDDPYNKVTIESLSGDLQLFDGRMNHNNGWFVLQQQHKTGCHQRCRQMDYHSERSGRLDVSAGYPDFTDRLSSHSGQGSRHRNGYT